VKRKKCAQKKLDRVSIVRDVRLADFSGLYWQFAVKSFAKRLDNSQREVHLPLLRAYRGRMCRVPFHHIRLEFANDFTVSD